MLTMYDGDEDVYRALEAGAATYLLKDMLSDDLVNIIREVCAGGRPLAAGIQARLDERSTYAALTPREIEVLDRVKLGMRNKEIAAVAAHQREDHPGAHQESAAQVESQRSIGCGERRAQARHHPPLADRIEAGIRRV